MKLPRWTPAAPAAIAARTAWAKAMVAHITDPTSNPSRPPTYGSPRWAALADDDPRKLAAAVVAAECWATDLDDLPDRMRHELDALRAAHEAAEEHHWAERFELGKKISHSAASPAAFALRAHYAKTHTERIAEARRPRPGDYPGQHTDAVQDGEAAA